MKITRQIKKNQAKQSAKDGYTLEVFVQKTSDGNYQIKDCSWYRNK